MDYLGIDIGGTYIKYSVIDRSGSLQKVEKIKTPHNLSDFLEVMYAIIDPVMFRIKGIGISLPGKIDMENGIVYFGGALTFLHNVSLKALIEEKYAIPCALSNDGKAAALAEWWIGHLKDIQNGAAIVLGTGIGCGLILNHQLYQGSHFQAGELSFLHDTSGKSSVNEMMGMKGSAVNFVQTGANILGLAHPDGPYVFEAIQSTENEELNQYFSEYCQSIARLISNLQVTLDLSKIVIGGGISSQPILIEEINIQYQKYRHTIPILASTFPTIEIAACRFKNEANLLGAIYGLLLQIEKQTGV